MPELIELGLEPLQLREYLMAEDFMSYRLHYESGAALTVAILYVEERHLIVFSKPVISISIADMDGEGRTRYNYLRYSIERPSNPNDMEFCMRLMARVAAMTRAVADELQIGARID